MTTVTQLERDTVVVRLVHAPDPVQVVDKHLAAIKREKHDMTTVIMSRRVMSCIQAEAAKVDEIHAQTAIPAYRARFDELVDEVGEALMFVSKRLKNTQRRDKMKFTRVTLSPRRKGRQPKKRIERRGAFLPRFINTLHNKPPMGEMRTEWLCRRLGSWPSPPVSGKQRRRPVIVPTTGFRSRVGQAR